jgi:O-antigen/teichoic acid export membrane protein
LLFSPEFRPATEFFGYQALGDIARVATLVTSTALIALSRPGQYIGLEIIRFMIFIAASYMLLPAMGPSGAAAAYMVSYGLSAAIGVALMLLARDDGAVIGLQA